MDGLAQANSTVARLNHPCEFIVVTLRESESFGYKGSEFMFGSSKVKALELSWSGDSEISPWNLGASHASGRWIYFLTGTSLSHQLPLLEMISVDDSVGAVGTRVMYRYFSRERTTISTLGGPSAVLPGCSLLG